MSDLVEVKDEEQLCYMLGSLLDVSGQKYLVKLGSAQRWVRWDLVQEKPAEDVDFPIEQDMFVEVKCHADGDSEPPSWWEAQVKSIKGEFYKVTFVGDGKDEIIEKERIRPAYGRQAAAARSKPSFVKQIFPLGAAAMHQWCLDNPQSVEDVAAKSRVVGLFVDPRRPQIKILGSEKAIARAKMLLELHGKHASDFQRLHNEREQLALKLQAEKEKMITGVRLEFAIEKELIGLVVGKKGSSISEAQKACGVDRVEVDPDGLRVVISGPTQESIEAAREMLEFVRERVPVQPEQVGWLIGKSGRNFKELQDKTKLTRLNVDKEKNEVVLVGTKTAVEAARLYMDTHLQYLSNFENEQRESDKLRQELRGISHFDVDSEPTGDRGGRGGKGKGRGAGSSNAALGGRGASRENGAPNTSRPATQRNAPAAAAVAADSEPSDAAAGGRGGGTGRGKGKGAASGRGSKGGRGAGAPATAPPDAAAEPAEPAANGASGANPQPQRSAPRRGTGKGRGGGRGGSGGAAEKSSA